MVKTVDGGDLTADDFPVFIDGEAKAWGVTYTLDPGTYTASETQQTGYTTTGWGEACDTDGNVTLAAGDNLTCTITNTYTPEPEPEYMITFVKRECDDYSDIRGNHNATHLAENAEPLGAVMDWNVVNPQNEGETCAPVSGWSFSMGTSFHSGGTPDDLSYATGLYGTYETLPSTPLLDEYGNDTGSTIAGAVTVTLNDEQVARVESGKKLWISETLVDGALPGDYGFGAIRCDVDNLNGDNAEWVKFATPESPSYYGAVTHKFCYAYNVTPPEPEPGKIIVKKVTDVESDQLFDFTASYDADGFQLADGDSDDSGDLTAGTYSVTEGTTDGWTLISASCDDGSDPSSIDLAEGETVTCTFTNTKDQPEPASLTIVKGSLDGTGEFSFLSQELTDFTLDTTTANPDSKTFSDLEAGTYTVAEDLDALAEGWTFVQASLSCGGFEGATLDRANASVTVDLQPGDNVTCTFGNQFREHAPDAPAIDIEKATNGKDGDDPKGDIALIDLNVDPTVEWTYVVTNTGNVDLTDIVVSDDKEGEVCTIALLQVGKSSDCTLLGVATLGLYGNIATASTTYKGQSVTDTDPSHYIGQEVGGTAQLGDTVWLDANKNGVQDNGEVGFNGAKVILKDGEGNVIATATTATGAWVGFYKFVGLDAGTYTAMLDLSSVSGYEVTTAKSFTITLAEGDDYIEADFGLFKEEELPKTGADTEGITLFALGLLMLGTLAVLSTRRKREDSSSHSIHRPLDGGRPTGRPTFAFSSSAVPIQFAARTRTARYREVCQRTGQS